jgi:hypothetical protein
MGEPPPEGETPGETPQAAAPADQTAPLEPEDETTRLTPEDLARPTVDPGATSIMPSGEDVPAWSGRAGVPVPPGGLRDSAPYQPGEPPPPRAWWTPALLGMLALGLVGIVVLAAYMISRESRPAPNPTPTSTPAPQPTHTPAPATTAPGSLTPSAQLVQVPADLVGMTQGKATALLDTVGLSYSLVFQESSEPKGTVIKTSPESGKLVPALSVVKLTISLGGASPTPTATTTTTP